MSQSQGFVIIMSAPDHKVIDFTMSDVIKAVRDSGATLKGPILCKNTRIENGTLIHTRKLKVIDPSSDTTQALSNVSIPKEVRCKIVQN